MNKEICKTCVYKDSITFPWEANICDRKCRDNNLYKQKNGCIKCTYNNNGNGTYNIIGDMGQVAKPYLKCCSDCCYESNFIGVE